METVGIIGCGWLGKKLASRLSEESKIYATSSSEVTANALGEHGYIATPVVFSEDEVNITAQWDDISSLESLVILLPLSLRISKDKLQNKLQNLLAFIGKYDGQLFYSSSTGVYPTGPKTYEEGDLDPSDTFIENAIKEKHPQTNILRFGGLMGGDRLLSNYKVSNLQDPANHIHYKDACSLIIKMIKENQSEKVYNVVAPLHPSKQQIIDAQETGILSPYRESEGRKISSSNLIRDLGFTFEFPDPRTFHL